MNRSDRVSSPAATGGAGTLFEQHVDASWLALLLVRGIPPVLHDCAIVEVRFQTECLGWKTDDFLIIGEDGSGLQRRLLGQVKRTLRVSASDDDFKETIQDAWTDLGNPGFNHDSDRFGIVTLRGTDALLIHFSALLDCARASRTGSELEQRLDTPGFVDARVARYCDQVRTVLCDAQGRDFSRADVWPLLRVLNVLSFDLTTATGQTEATIRSLLAHTATSADPQGAAGATWNALVGLAAGGMSQACAYSREDLPEVLRARHTPVLGGDVRALQALSDHSNLILDGIRSTIGRTLHLGREPLVQQVLQTLTTSQIVLLSGVSGSGKSSLAKDVVRALRSTHFVFCFRAEEFALPHLDEVLQNTQVGISGATLGALLAGQTKKVLLVDSIERLLEKATRDAFADLLTLVSRDGSWRVLLTCRDYSVDLVRTSLLARDGLEHEAVQVPVLTEDEVAQAKAALPELARPLSNPQLVRLLRNPYFLSLAVEMSWPEDRPLPESERQFRARFWQHVVRADHRGSGGMPTRRGVALVSIALQRARSLNAFVTADHVEPAVIDSLWHDSLITRRGDSTLVAPAHDVLEDWAILHWLGEQFEAQDRTVLEMAAEVGTFPALRRTYRKWISELAAYDPQRADRLWMDTLAEKNLPAHFRDDTLVALLQAPDASAFLTRHCEEFFGGDCQLLARLVHLLRVACMALPPGVAAANRHLALFSRPEGVAWKTVLELIASRLDVIPSGQHSLLLGLVEDWSRGVAWWSPYPEGSVPAAQIAYFLVSQFDRHTGDEHERTLKVIAKIPICAPERFISLMTPDPTDWERTHLADEMRELILTGLEGMPACRDLPDSVISAARDEFLHSEPEDGNDDSDLGTHATEIQDLFGIRYSADYKFFPPSAYCGPFLHLLRYHPRDGLDFLLSLVNHCGEWYGHPRLRVQFVEPPFQISLSFPDGSSRLQWCNSRLWNMYRATSVGPNLLQSCLMALERWLLDMAEVNPESLAPTLIEILRRSESAAATAVVASIATAFPQLATEALLVLLGTKECFLLDRARMVNEVQAPSHLSEMMPMLDAGKRLFEQERKESDHLPHRKVDLESAVLNLQLTPAAPRVHSLLDRLLNRQPPCDDQCDEDRLWRLALHRMDLRQYSVAQPQGARSPDAGDNDEGERETRRIEIRLKPPAPDIQKMLSENESNRNARDARLSLQMWALAVYERRSDGPHDSAEWHARLQQAQTMIGQDADQDEIDYASSGPGVVAAVCVRDHWEELSPDEQAWCMDLVRSEVECTSGNWNHIARVQRHPLSAVRPCAFILSSLLGRQQTEPNRRHLVSALATALTHPVDDVRQYAAAGVGVHLWNSNSALALRCVRMLMTEAALVQKALRDESKMPFAQRRELSDIEFEVAALVRDRFPDDDFGTETAGKAFDPSEGVGAEANNRILTIFFHNPNGTEAIAAFRQLATTLSEWWDYNDDRDERRERNYHIEPQQQEILSKFVLRTPRDAAESILVPILEAIDSHPREVARFIKSLILAEDLHHTTSNFWHVWQLFADKARSANWLGGVDDRYSSGHEVLDALFLGLPWKDGVTHWTCLEGHADRVIALFESLPASASATRAFLRFLYNIGEKSLPNSFMTVATKLRSGTPGELVRDGNSLFMIEELLQRYVYGKPAELKRHKELRDAVIYILDVLVERGSSAAFRMRDDFVTPFSET